MEYDYQENPQRFTVLPEGVYEAQVTAYQDKTSKQGNSMCELSLKVFHDSQEITVRDWLVNTSGSQWKIKGFVEAVGQTYGPGNVLDMDKAMTKLFRVALKVEPFIKQNGDKQDTNKVDCYLPLAVGEPGANVPDSDLPF